MPEAVGLLITMGGLGVAVGDLEGRREGRREGSHEGRRDGLWVGDFDGLCECTGGGLELPIDGALEGYCVGISVGFEENSIEYDNFND